MAAYVLVEIEVRDAARYEDYKSAAAPSIAKYGGKYLARGGAAEALEGAPPQRVVVLEFADVAAARRWYASPDYQAAVALRRPAATARFVLVEGL
jgi:uncharacterized protein (DUF1330 family)